MKPIRLATRRSALALAQSRSVADQVMAATGGAVELVEVVTQGDLDPAPLAAIGGTGVFVTAIRAAVLDGRADIAVHSLKDLPTAPVEGLTVAAIPLREDPRDALVSRHPGGLSGLPAGARVGTGSPRRHAQLMSLRPDLDVVGIRGNVDSRIARVRSMGETPGLDAVVLAAAGLARLGRSDEVSQFIDADLMLPAPGQGALALEISEDRPDLAAMLAHLDHGPTRGAVLAERSLLAALEAGCSAPVGALAVVDGDGEQERLRLEAVIADRPGARMSITGSARRAEHLGQELARQMLSVTAAG